MSGEWERGSKEIGSPSARPGYDRRLDKGGEAQERRLTGQAGSSPRIAV
jgi:hypothetical protein